jgi:hypothetical protein
MRHGTYSEAQNADLRDAAFYNVQYIAFPAWDILGRNRLLNQQHHRRLRPERLHKHQEPETTKGSGLLLGGGGDHHIGLESPFR